MLYLCKIGFNGGNFGPQLLTFCELNTETPFSTILQQIIFADLVFQYVPQKSLWGMRNLEKSYLKYSKNLETSKAVDQRTSRFLNKQDRL